MKKSLLKKISEVKVVQTPTVTVDDNVKRCKKCKGELTVLSRQTRSADEGATTFYNCKRCSYTVKVN